MSYDRKAYSAEPQTAAAILGKRWEDLIDAAASATEEDSRDLTPVCLLFVFDGFELIVEGTTITVHVTTHDGAKVVAAVRSLTTAVIHSVATGQLFNATASGYVRASAIPFRRIVHRLSHLGPKLPHPLTRPFRFVPYLPLPCPDILCCLP